MFQMRGVMHIGYRQLETERWGASPLYVLDFADEAARERIYREGGVLRSGSNGSAAPIASAFA